MCAILISSFLANIKFEREVDIREWRTFWKLDIEFNCQFENQKSPSFCSPTCWSSTKQEGKGDGVMRNDVVNLPALSWHSTRWVAVSHQVAPFLHSHINFMFIAYVFKVSSIYGDIRFILMRALNPLSSSFKDSRSSSENPNRVAYNITSLKMQYHTTIMKRDPNTTWHHNTIKPCNIILHHHKIERWWSHYPSNQ